MNEEFVRDAGEDIPGLEGVFITAMPDCLLYAAWTKRDELNAGEVASYFGDLVRANREGLRALGKWSTDMQVTIEAADQLILIAEAGSEFICGCVFQRETPLGMARLNVRKIIKRIEGHLPQVEGQRVSRGTRVIGFLEKHAPNFRDALLRISARSGVSLEALGEPNSLSDEQVDRVEGAAKRVLGVETLKI